jgi:hypothetical protein
VPTGRPCARRCWWVPAGERAPPPPPLAGGAAPTPERTLPRRQRAYRAPLCGTKPAALRATPVADRPAVLPSAITPWGLWPIRTSCGNRAPCRCRADSRLARTRSRQHPAASLVSSNTGVSRSAEAVWRTWERGGRSEILLLMIKAPHWKCGASDFDCGERPRFGLDP